MVGIYNLSFATLNRGYNLIHKLLAVREHSERHREREKPIANTNICTERMDV